MHSTYFGLLAEFGTAEIPLDQICDKYFGLSEKEAYNRASLNKLPISTYRAGSQKSKRLVSAAELAELLDSRKHKAQLEWKKFNNVA